MANPVLGKSRVLIVSFSVRILQYGPFPWKRSNPCILFWSEISEKKKTVNIVILHSETT